PRTMCSRVVLPEPLGPMTTTTPPAGTVKLACDQIGLPARTALTSVNAKAAEPEGSLDSDTERLTQRDELTVLPRLERCLTGRDGLGDIDDGESGLIGDRTDLLRDRPLGLGVIDQHVDVSAAQQGPERVEVSRRRI